MKLRSYYLLTLRFKDTFSCAGYYGWGELPKLYN